MEFYYPDNVKKSELSEAVADITHSLRKPMIDIMKTVNDLGVGALLPPFKADCGEQGNWKELG